MGLSSLQCIPLTGPKAGCPICDTHDARYMFTVGNYHFWHCQGCGLISSDTQKTTTIPSSISVKFYSQKLKARLKAEANLKKLCLIIPPTAPSLNADDIAGVDIVAANEGDPLPRDCDAVAIIGQLEFSLNPVGLLQKTRSALNKRGTLIIQLQTVAVHGERIINTQNAQYSCSPKWVFNQKTLTLALLKAGFEQVIWKAIDSTIVICTARARQVRPTPLVSVIVPVYNERKTFKELMDLLLVQRLAGADREIIIVESNSTDGTRDVALSYSNHPEVRVLLQDKPRGKGNAVREGFAAASGDILMIQDADLEYDLSDYDTLLQPLLTFKELYVLGARHGGDWKMRRFLGQPILALAMNIGHIFFTTLINVLYGQRMKDPFTMYKVIRRDCLYGLEFACNHFDFDHELVIKLALKGYTPLEIPVNYTSRSYRDGKKVNLLREPFRWLWVDLKNRF